MDMPQTDAELARPGRTWANVMLFLYIAFILAVPVMALLSGQAFDKKTLTYQAGRIAALLTFTILCLQILFSGRFKPIERHFGQDVLWRFHRRMALAATVLILFHPVLLAAGGAGPKLLYSFDLPWYVLLGRLTGTLLFVNVGVSFFQERLGLGFQGWRRLHDALGVSILALGFMHSWTVKGGFAGTSLAGLWPVLAGGSLLLIVWHRFVRPALAARRPYTVTEARQEVPGVWTLALTPPSGRASAFLPGQFHFLTLRRGPGLPKEEHHFTIASSPADLEALRSTIKESGDFTATMGETRPGHTAVVQGPFGRFSYLLHPSWRDLVFVTGGIGITPLMSMLRHMRDTGANLTVTLFYFNRTEADIVFRDELADMEAGKVPKLQVVHVLTRPQGDWSGERGHLSDQLFQRHLGRQLKGKLFFLSGPPDLVHKGARLLKRLGVEKTSILTESFSLLD